MAQKENKVTLSIVVAGNPTEVEANENAALQSVVEHALKQSGNVGQPADAYELKDERGNLLAMNLKVREVLAGGVLMFLSLKAGAAG